MEFHPDRPARRSIRLQTYDYADEGAYFVTLCTFHRECLFGEVVKGEMRLNAVGEIAYECWNAIPHHFPGVELDSYMIMPNHVHGIVVITERRGDGVNVGARHAVPLQGSNPPSHHEQSAKQAFGKPVPGSLPTIVGSFKSAAARHVNLLHNTPAAPLWQRNYYEHVIRDEGDLNPIREYIECNPQMWETDEENPARWMQKV
jgi:putative transposase